MGKLMLGKDNMLVGGMQQYVNLYDTNIFDSTNLCFEFDYIRRNLHSLR